jgi:zinc transport system ATP-binding protein
LTGVIEVEGVSILRDGMKVVDDADLTVEAGDYIGVVGPNGGGKTSLVLGILGLLPLDRGDIRIFGRPVAEFSEWDRVGYVAQDAIDFDPNFPMTVRELVGLGRIRRETVGRPLSAEDWKHVDSAMDLMDLGPLARRRVGHLSGGQKQRVFVAKAMVREPDLLILDEPVTGVDLRTQEEFYGLLSRVNRERGTTILMISHDLATVFCQMSKVACVNRTVHSAPITPDLDEGEFLKQAYGDHFTFVFHEHTCEFDHTGGEGHDH